MSDASQTLGLVHSIQIYSELAPTALCLKLTCETLPAVVAR
jgi:hypothetical protein